MAKVGNWVGQETATVGTGDIVLGPALPGHSKFIDAVDDDVDAWYAIIDDENREAGIGHINGNIFARTTIYVTLFNGGYDDVTPPPIPLSGTAQIFCTYNKSAFEQFEALLADTTQRLDTHIFDTNNPHEVTHLQLPDRGINDHSAIDAHLASEADPHNVQHEQLGNVLPDQHHDQSHSHDGLDGSGTVAHDDTTGIGTDNHHPISHAHDGIDGSGRVSHFDLTDVGPDQHHPQIHDLESHSDVSYFYNPLADGQGLWYNFSTSEWVNRAGYSESFPTGLVDGGELNFVAGEIQAVAGTGVIVNTFTDPLSAPNVIGVRWDTLQEPITIVPPVAGSIVWLSIGNTGIPIPGPSDLKLFEGELLQYSQTPSPNLARSEVFLGIAVHNGIEWKEVSNPKTINTTAETLREVVTDVLALTHIISGGAITTLPAFELDMEEAVVWENNRNWHVDKSDPNREALPAISPIIFQYVTQDFSSVGAYISVIDATTYDVGGVPTPVPGSALVCTIQKLFIDPANNYWNLYGQITYANFDVAMAELEADLAASTIPYILQNSILLGYIVTSKTDSDWGATAVWIPTGGKAGQFGGGGIPITDHKNLTSIGLNSHDQIDTHINDGTIHYPDAISDGRQYAREDNTWTPIVDSIIQGVWLWNDQTVGDPGIGYMGSQNGQLSAVTELRVSGTTAGGESIPPDALYSPGDIIYVIDEDRNSFGRYEVAFITDNVTWKAFEVITQQGSGNPLGDDVMDVAYLPQAEVPDPPTFSGAGTTGYVPDPIVENNYFLRDDGSFSPGVKDNTTANRINIFDSQVQMGAAGVAYSITGVATDQNFALYAGGSGGGANLLLYAGDHASFPNYIALRAGASNQLVIYGGVADFQSNRILAGADVTISGATPRFYMSETDTTDKNIRLQLNNGDFTIQRSDDAGGFLDNLLNWDDDISTWDFYAKPIKTTGLIDAGSMQISSSAVSLLFQETGVADKNKRFLLDGGDFSLQRLSDVGGFLGNLLIFSESGNSWDFASAHIFTLGNIGIGAAQGSDLLTLTAVTPAMRFVDTTDSSFTRMRYDFATWIMDVNGTEVMRSTNSLFAVNIATQINKSQSAFYSRALIIRDSSAGSNIELGHMNDQVVGTGGYMDQESNFMAFQMGGVEVWRYSTAGLRINGASLTNALSFKSTDGSFAYINSFLADGTTDGPSYWTTTSITFASVFLGAAMFFASDEEIGLPIGKFAAANGLGDGWAYSGTAGHMLSSRTTAARAPHVHFYTPDGYAGRISTIGVTTAYETSSDYRMKENDIPLYDALIRIMTLNPIRFNFLADPDRTVDGFMAHEVADVVPEAISGVKDGGEMQGIDQSKLVPLLVAAIQELNVRLKAAEAAIT